MISIRNAPSQSTKLSIVLILFLCFLGSSCARNSKNNSANAVPNTFLWAWENREDLRFLNPDEFGVAFLAQSLFLEKNDVVLIPRRQPLKVSPRTYLIAVTRIETRKAEDAPIFSVEQKDKLISLLQKTAQLPRVKAIQLDFDVVQSERSFYREVIVDLRKQLPKHIDLTITALASWCADDRWFGDLPINEAIPMLFQMGNDKIRVRKLLLDGVDWKEPLCRKSYGLALDEPFTIGLKSNRHRFYFKSGSWKEPDLQKLNR